MGNKLDFVTRSQIINTPTAKLRKLLNNREVPKSYKNIVYTELQRRRHALR